MVTLREIQMTVCETCGGDKEIRTLASSFGPTIRVTRCKTGGCAQSKPLSEMSGPMRLAE